MVEPYAGQHNNLNYLLQDQFSVHMNTENIIALLTAGVEVDFILAGCTPILQVMDKSLQNPFKQYLRHMGRVRNQLISTLPTGYKLHGIKIIITSVVECSCGVGWSQHIKIIASRARVDGGIPPAHSFFKGVATLLKICS